MCTMWVTCSYNTTQNYLLHVLYVPVMVVLVKFIIIPKGTCDAWLTVIASSNNPVSSFTTYVDWLNITPAKFFLLI